MAKYPIYLELSGRRAVVIGGGGVAARKVKAMAEAGARVTVVAPYIQPAFESEFSLPNVELVLCCYAKEYLTGATLAVVATDDPELNRRIYADCQELEVLCNVVDQPHLCDFYVPAVVRRGDLQIAIGTEGNCPAYAGHVRKQLEEIFTETHGQFVDELEKIRSRILREVNDPNQRKALLGRLVSEESFDYFSQHGARQWHAYAGELMKNPEA